MRSIDPEATDIPVSGRTDGSEMTDSPERAASPDGADSPESRDGAESPDGAGVADEATSTSSGKRAKKRRPARTIIEWAAVIGGAFLVALLVRSTLVQAFWIPSPSMEPTLEEGDRVLVNKLSYRLHDVHRGDIVVFERPATALAADPSDDIPDLIKRVIGLPGETIEARADGFVYIDGERLNEPYLPPDTRTVDLPPTEIEAGEVFVMGDNRANSSDSRIFGAIDEDLIVGRAFIRIWPLNEVGGL